MIKRVIESIEPDGEVIDELKMAIKQESGFNADWWSTFGNRLAAFNEPGFRGIEGSSIFIRSIALFSVSCADAKLFDEVKQEVYSWLDLKYLQRSSGTMKPAIIINEKQKELIDKYFSRKILV